MPPLRIADNNVEPPHVFIGSRPVQKIYSRENLLWSNITPPRILNFNVSPASIDLDARPSGNIEFDFSVQGQAGETTHAQVVRLPAGSNVGPEYQGIGVAGIMERLSNIPQPTETTVYRLLARNSGGTSHRDIRVDVSQNPVVRNFRRTGFVQNQGNEGQFEFQATIVGTPQPALTYRFSNGTQGQITPRHLTTAGQNTWTMRWRIFHSNTTDSLILTATNSSGAVSATISNIGA